MAVNKPRVNVTTSVAVVIFLLTFFGMMPFSMPCYYRHRILKTSIFANIYLIFSTIHYAVQYSIETIANAEGDNRDSGWYILVCSKKIET